jgi:DNA-directed RNA polymerase specialized sigma24 family protein
VTRHGPGLYAYILVLIRDKTAADDVHQETLLKAWRALEPGRSYQPRGNFTPLAPS